MNVHSQARLTELAPQVQDLWIKVDAMLSAEGITVEVVQGLRTFNTQAALYAQGREPLLQVNAMRAAVGLTAITDVDNAKHVTWAKPGESYHNLALALDCTPFADDATPIWDIEAPQFIRMVDVARSLGFTCGYDWEGQKKDSDHFQLTGVFPVSPTAEVQQLFTEGGVQAVWVAAFDGQS